MPSAKDIFLRALELATPDERREFVVKECAGNQELQRVVDALLEAHDDPESYLERPAARFDVTATRDGSGRDSGLSDSSSSHHGRFLPGTRVADRYRIVSLLGRGGMGEVYRADDLRLGQTVALKFLPPELAKDTKRLEYFHNEVRLARQISHPNVCRVYDIGEVDGQHFISMEYIDGEDLKTLLHRIGRLPKDKGIQIAQQLCSGLSAAHAKGVLHRDLKPANIMIDGQGQARITDFGLATATVDGENVIGMSGTPAYMAPEQLLRGQTNVQSDLYSLGLILYELFSGRSAYEASSLPELRRLHEESSSVAPPSRHVDEIDPAVERVILSVLESDPLNRPKSAAQISAALPGGNPLAAALAAGETPSPELVAASGPDGALSQKTASILLAIVFTCLAIIFFASPTSQIVNRLEPLKSPEVLAERSRQIMAKLGYDDQAADSAFGYNAQSRTVLKLSPDNTSIFRRWTANASEFKPGIFFWYRDSPVRLFQNEVFAGRDSHADGRVNYQAPAFNDPGMRRIKLDPTGRLRHFAAIPPQVAHSNEPSDEIVWQDVLSPDVLGYDLSTLKSANWRMPCSVPADVMQSWEGQWPGTDDPVYLQAASYHGRLSEFRYLDKWQLAANGKPAAERNSTRTRIVVAVELLSIICAAAFAFRNLTTGRGDTKATKPLATWAIVLMMLLWLFKASHVQHEDEFGLFHIGIQNAAGYAFLVMIIYFAFEPLVRQRCPALLVSWTRLLRSRPYDCLVGRDILIGCSIASLSASLRDVAGAFGLFAPRSLIASSLGGVDATVVAILESHSEGLIVSMFCLVLYVLIFVLVRSKWITIVVLVAFVAVLESLTHRAVPLGWIIAVLIACGQVTCFANYGLLGAATTLTVQEMLRHPITSDAEQFYFAGGVAMLAAIMALAIYSSRIAVGAVRT